MDTEEYQFQSELHRFNWLYLPAQAGKISGKLLIVLTDGYFLCISKAGGIISPLLFILGLIWGWQHFDFQYVYTESFWFLLAAVILGSISSHLGLLFTLGFILGNSILSDINFGDKSFLVKSAGLLVSYLVLLLLTTMQSIPIKYLVGELKFSKINNRHIKQVLLIIVYLLLTFCFIYFWLLAAPILIQPMYTWLGGSTSPAPVIVTKEELNWLLSAGLIAAFIRLFIQYRMSMNHANDNFFRFYEKSIHDISLNKPFTYSINPWIRFFINTAISLLTIAGLFNSWLPAILVFVLYFLFYCIRIGFIPWPPWLVKWASVIGKVPTLIKLIAGTFLVYLVIRFIVFGIIDAESVNNFSLVIITFCGLSIFFFLNPVRALKKTDNA